MDKSYNKRSYVDEECILSIIIVNYNTKELLGQCIRSILDNAPSYLFEIVVVDNASHDGSPQFIQDNHESVKIIVNETNLGFSMCNNVGIQAAEGKYVLLLNSDTIVMPGALDVLVGYLDQKSDVAAVGPMLLNKDLTIQRSWFDFPSIAKILSHILGLSPFIHKMASYAYLASTLSYLGVTPAFLKQNLSEPSQVDYLIFACVLVRRTVFEGIGLLDEGLFFYHEDYEFGYRMFNHGLRLHYLPSAKVIHLGGSTSTKYLLKTYRENYKSLFYVYGKHYGITKNILLRVYIALGFTIRSILWFFGGYHRVKKLGIYTDNDAIANQDEPRPTDVLRIYLTIIKDSIFENRTPREVRRLPSR